ncbi:MAG: replicative DNA helicase [Betaproteobacteria bacterium]
MSDESQSRVPHNREAEAGVIGSLLINPDLFPTLSDLLQPQDFYLGRHRFIWEACARLYATGLNMDAVTVAEELNNSGKLAEVGGQDYLFKLAGNTPNSLYAEDYAQQVKESAKKRSILHLLTELARFSYDEHPVNQILEHARRELDLIAASGQAAPTFDATPLLLARCDELLEGVPQQASLSTGLQGLDERLNGGLRRDRLYIVAGRPGSGKSALLLGIALQAAMRGHRVGFFTLEMPVEEQLDRLLSMLSGVPNQRIETGRLEDHDKGEIRRVKENVPQLPITFDELAGYTIPELRAQCRRMAARGLDLVVLDSLNLLDPQANGEKPYERINWLAVQLKLIARELGVPVLAAHHMSRRIELGAERDPELSDLEQAGEKPADVVAFLYRGPKSGPKNIRRLLIAKQRSGPTGLVELVFLAPTLRFVDGDLLHEEEG